MLMHHYWHCTALTSLFEGFLISSACLQKQTSVGTCEGSHHFVLAAGLKAYTTFRAADAKSTYWEACMFLHVLY